MREKLSALCLQSRGGISILFVMMASDIVTGILCALMGKSCKSKNGSFSLLTFGRGILRKLLMLLVIVLSALLDGFAQLQGILLGTAVWFYVANEGLSVVENLLGMGVPVPGKFNLLLRNSKQGGS